MLELLDALINRALALDPDTRARLAELDGRVIRLRLLAGGGKPILECDVLPAKDGIRLRAADAESRQADVVLGGNAAAFGRALFGEALPSAAASAEAALEIRGDVELGRRFEQILKGFDPDWEEGLARLVGDVVAHELGRLARAAASEARHAARTLALDLAEYLREEARIAAPRERVEAFLQAVDRLRADVDRLEARLAHLDRRLSPSGETP
jgi:ubiquinone biosynthesis protein UbiJ